jgi:tight adherence protein C
MNPTLIAFGFFAAVFLGAVLVFGTRLIIRWQRLRRDEAAQSAELEQVAANAFSPDEPVRTPAETPLTEGPLSTTPLTNAPPVPESYPEPPPLPADVTAPVRELVGAESTVVSAAGDGQSWTPPQPVGWAPEATGVSWADQSLFHTRETSFEEPTHIPKVLPSDIPSNTDDYVLGASTPALASLMPLTDRTRVENELSQAGYYQPHALQNLSAIRFFGILLSLMFFGILFMFVPPFLEIPVAITALVVPMLFWAVPRVLIQNRATDRKSEIERAMPDMLDMLNMCVSQGLTIRASMHRISGDLRPVYPVLASELAIVSRQTEIGNLRVALNNFADRVNVAEVDSFVSLMNQSEQMGTSISDALTEYSNTMRESLRQRTDEKANKASFNLMFPTVLFMMPAVFMFLMGPAVLELQDFFDEGGVDNLQQGTDAIQNADAANQQR